MAKKERKNLIHLPKNYSAEGGFYRTISFRKNLFFFFKINSATFHYFFATKEGIKD